MSSLVHILFSRNEPRPWWPAHQRLNTANDTRLFTDCCACWMRADECDARLLCAEVPIGPDVGDYQIGTDWDGRPFGFDYPYDEPRIQIRCADGFGCDAKPRRKCGRELRELCHYGI